MEVQKVRLRIYGMTCDDCAATISKSLKGEDGVLEVKVSLEDGLGEVAFNPERVKPADILKNKIFAKPSHYKATIDDQ